MAINRTVPNAKGLKVEVERSVIGGKPAAAASDSPRPPAPRAAEGGPRYLEMQRVDGRIRPDQSEDLAALRRQLLRARVDRSERITDNTLLRVAVDLLLAHAEQLAGATEDDLAASVLTEEQMQRRDDRMGR